MTRTPRVLPAVSPTNLLIRLALILPLVQFPSLGVAQSNPQTSSSGDQCAGVRDAKWYGDIQGVSNPNDMYFWDFVKSNDPQAAQNWNSMNGDQRCGVYKANFQHAVSQGNAFTDLIMDTDPNTACQEYMNDQDKKVACQKQKMEDLKGPGAANLVNSLGAGGHALYERHIQKNLQGLGQALGLNPKQIKKIQAQQVASLNAAGSTLSGGSAANAAQAVSGPNQAAGLGKTFDGSNGKGGAAGSGSGQLAGASAVGGGVANAGALATPESRYASMGGGEAPPAPVEKNQGNFFSNLFGGESAADKANDKVKDDNSQLEDNNKAIQDDRADYKKYLDQSEPLGAQAAKDKQAADQAEAAYKAAANASANPSDPEVQRLKEQWQSAADKENKSDQALKVVQSKMDADYNDYMGHVASNQKVLDDLSQDTYTRDTRRQMSDLDSQNSSLKDENERLAKEEKDEPERKEEIDAQIAKNTAQMNANENQRVADSRAWEAKYGTTAPPGQPPTGAAFARQLPPGSLVRTEGGTTSPSGDWQQTYKVTPPSGGADYDMTMSKHTDPASGQMTMREEISSPSGSTNPPTKYTMADSYIQGIQRGLPPGTTFTDEGGTVSPQSGEWERTYRVTPPGQAPGAGDYEMKLTQQRDPQTGKWVLQQVMTPVPPALTQTNPDPGKPTPRYVAGPKPPVTGQQPYYYQGDVSAQQASPQAKAYAKSVAGNNNQPSPAASPSEKAFQADAQQRQQSAAPNDQKALDEQNLLTECSSASEVAQYCSSELNNIMNPKLCANSPTQSFWNSCGNARRDLHAGS